jgi:hypothetical protein
MLLRALVLLPLLGAFAGGADPPPSKDRQVDSSKQLEAWWADLEDEDYKASRALLNLADRPAESVAFLKDKLKALKLDSVRLKAFLLRLGSDNEALWKQAFEDLEYFDPRLAMDLEPLLAKVTESPTRQRLVEVLSGREAGSLKDKKISLNKYQNFYNFGAENGSWWAEDKVSRINANSWGCPKKKWTRAVRAMALLEHLHTPDALATLREMASGHPDAQPTRVAQDALKRLGAARS